MEVKNRISLMGDTLQENIMFSYHFFFLLLPELQGSGRMIISKI